MTKAFIRSTLRAALSARAEEIPSSPLDAEQDNPLRFLGLVGIPAHIIVTITILGWRKRADHLKRLLQVKSLRNDPGDVEGRGLLNDRRLNCWLRRMWRYKTSVVSSLLRGSG